MARINLKNVLGKNNELHGILLALAGQMNAAIWIEDNTGKLLLGEKREDDSNPFPILAEGEITGWIKGDENGFIIANLLNYFLQKETDKKKLGSEVLNLYQEINLIYNFSEKLAQAIDPAALAQLALHEATHSIASTAGVVLLWDDESKTLQLPATTEQALLTETSLEVQDSLLLTLGLGGQSEIISDMTEFTAAGIINTELQSLLYAALKVNNRVMGSIILAHKDKVQYTAGDLKLLVTLALQSSAAIESALQYEKNIREVKAREEAILRIHEVTKKFVPHEFIRSLGKETLADVKLGDQVEKIVTVLFTDIRDFTSLSEKMTPEENFQFVSSFNAQLGPIIRQHNGFINQYLGDSIMALFPQHPEDALRAAIAMQKAVYELNLIRKSKGYPSIKAGIGMHTGPLIMGITGDEYRLDAATISDAVNTAARIESLTKYYKAPLLLSGETLSHISQENTYYLRHLGKVQLKGKYKQLSIIECMNGYSPEGLSKKMLTLSRFNQAMQYYTEQRFENAIMEFENLLVTDTDDLTAVYFRDNAIKYLKNGIPENWTGAEEMLSK
ncbi:MAG: adenylate/guanylate cyclase domain-containing protein [Ferruginibacter sp.]